MREVKIINECIDKFQLNLNGLTVFTEAASGYYALTPLIALMAGAEKVYAIAKDSRFGGKEEVKENLLGLAEKMGIKTKPEIIFDYSGIDEADIITNLGSVRPVNSILLNRLKKNVVIPLMWETWEFREEDLDIRECLKNNIMVLGTNEHHPGLQIFRYVGMLAIKLLFELNLEIFRSKILVCGGGDFAEQITGSLIANGAETALVCEERFCTDKLDKYKISNSLNDNNIKDFLQSADAIVFADHQSQSKWIGDDMDFTAAALKRINPDIRIAHISGYIDEKEIRDAGITMHPARIASKPMFMSVATDYTGPRPLIELHTAGLKTGEIMSSALRDNPDFNAAKSAALKNSLCMDFSAEQYKEFGI